MTCIRRWSFVTLTMTLWGLILISSPTQAQDTDTAEVERVVDEFFSSVLAEFDYALFDEMVTPTARFIEVGEIMSPADFKSFMRRFDGRWTMSYTLSERRTVVKGDIAYTSHRNRAEIVADGEPRTAEWLESIVLRRVDGSWRIDQLQSASVN